MVKWLVTLFVALVILSAATPLLRRFRIGRLPGDFEIPVRGRVYYIPFATTVVLSLLVWLIGRLL
ncbi:MAG TPA: DUF2905 domain-containing protein [Burkholderiales bacterium]|nr:DUF2905 domain-containing protein [Burkholderiales bacterium]